MEPIIHSIFEKQTSTWQYIVACPQSRQAVIIDPVLDFDPTKLEITTASADGLLELVASRNYIIVRLLETHAHADHLTSAYYIQQNLLAATNHHARVTEFVKCRRHFLRSTTYLRKNWTKHLAIFSKTMKSFQSVL